MTYFSVFSDAGLLVEGTNLVANVVGCEPTDVFIGMPVKGRVEAVDHKTHLPQFYPLDTFPGDAS